MDYFRCGGPTSVFFWFGDQWIGDLDLFFDLCFVAINCCEAITHGGPISQR